MGLVLLGADNLASDQADQKPSVVSRPKQAGRVPGPWIEVVDLGENNVKVIFHDFSEWPTEKWNNLKTELLANEVNLVAVDMSSCPMNTIGEAAFYGQSYLADVVFPPAVEIIGKHAFMYATSFDLKSIPETVKRIENQAFRNTASTISLLPASVEMVGSYAFAVTKIKNIELASYANYQGVFLACDDLEKVWIRDSVQMIQAQNNTQAFFRGCPDTIEIYAEPSSIKPQWGPYYNYISTVPYGGEDKQINVVYGQSTSPF